MSKDGFTTIFSYKSSMNFYHDYYLQPSKCQRRDRLVIKKANILESDCTASSLSPDICVTLRSLLNAFMPQFLHPESGDTFCFVLKIKHIHIN